LGKSVQFTCAGRQLEVQTTDVGQSVQVWICEAGKPRHLYSAISIQQVNEVQKSGQTLIEAVMQAAQSDVEKGKLVLPAS
jgi:hypothetical protein